MRYHKRPEVSDPGHMEARGRRGHGEKAIHAKQRPLGKKHRFDLLEMYRQRFFHYQEKVEDDKVQAARHQMQWKGRHPEYWVWKGGQYYTSTKDSFRWDFECCSYRWHYEWMVEYRDKYLALYREMEAEGLVPPFPFGL